MTQITVSPLPKWVLDTFEGRFLEAWLGSHAKGDLVEISGDTESEDEEDIILLDMTPAEIKEFAQLAEDAGTPLCKDIARLLNDPKGTGIMNEYFGKIDISSVRMEVVLKNKKGENLVMDPDHLLHSLVSRFPEEIPYVETTWERGGTFITPEGVEWFNKKAPLDARKAEFLGASASPAPRG